MLLPVPCPVKTQHRRSRKYISLPWTPRTNGLFRVLELPADFWGFCSPARKWLMPVAEEPIGVHDQLYKRWAVERREEIDAPGVKISVSQFPQLKHRGKSTLLSITRGSGSSTPRFLFTRCLDDLINAFRAERVGCFLNGLFTDHLQDLGLGNCETHVVLSANKQGSGRPVFLSLDIVPLFQRDHGVLIRGQSHFTYFGCSPLLHGSYS